MSPLRARAVLCALTLAHSANSRVEVMVPNGETSRWAEWQPRDAEDTRGHLMGFCSANAFLSEALIDNLWMTVMQLHRLWEHGELGPRGRRG